MIEPEQVEGVAGRRAEAQRIMAQADERARELTLLREQARRLRDECSEIEAEAQAILRRLLLAADAAGADELGAAARRELHAIDREV